MTIISKTSLVLVTTALFSSLCIAGEVVYVQSLYTRLLAMPDLSAETILKLKSGTKLKVVEKDGSWLKVSVGKKTGWVYAFSITDQLPAARRSLRAFQFQQDAKKARRKPSSVPATAAVRGLDNLENGDAATQQETQSQDQQDLPNKHP